MSLELTKKQIEVFWSHVHKTDNHWYWIGSNFTRDGYGLFYTKNEIFAHRIAYLLSVGSIPKSKPELDHYCHIRYCVNPDHMLPTDRYGNIRTRLRKAPYFDNGKRDVKKLLKTICPNGHKVTLLKVSDDGGVRCAHCITDNNNMQVEEKIKINDIEGLCKKGENNFHGNFKVAIKILLFKKGIVTYSKSVTQALRWLEKYEIDLELLQQYYGLTETKTRLRKPRFDDSVTEE